MLAIYIKDRFANVRSSPRNTWNTKIYLLVRIIAHNLLQILEMFKQTRHVSWVERKLMLTWDLGLKNLTVFFKILTAKHEKKIEFEITKLSPNSAKIS